MNHNGLSKIEISFGSLTLDDFGGTESSPNKSSPPQQMMFDPNIEIFARKVFIGGLPMDISEEQIKSTFNKFGPCIVDWPHKSETKAFYPPKGYAFLIFENETSVQYLVNSCLKEDDKYYLGVNSQTCKDKPVQVRPWCLVDSEYYLDRALSLDLRKTVFIGGVPRPLKAHELAESMNNLYGGVCYAGIDIDPDLKYPKGAGRVSFSKHESYIAAIAGRFIQLQHTDINKRAEVKPYVLDDQMCDECNGTLCNGKYAAYFCSNVTCLQYYCEVCWPKMHEKPNRRDHRPLIKQNSADRQHQYLLRHAIVAAAAASTPNTGCTAPAGGSLACLQAPPSSSMLAPLTAAFPPTLVNSDQQGALNFGVGSSSSAPSIMPQIASLYPTTYRCIY